MGPNGSTDGSDGCSLTKDSQGARPRRPEVAGRLGDERAGVCRGNLPHSGPPECAGTIFPVRRRDRYCSSDQQDLLKKVVSNEWSVRQLEAAVRNLSSSSSSSSKKKKSMDSKKSTDDPFYNDISTRLRQKFSTKVQINPKAKGGEIKIEYYSEDDLERILAIFDSI